MFEGNKKARLKNCFSGGLSRFFPRKTQTNPPQGPLITAAGRRGGPRSGVFGSFQQTWVPQQIGTPPREMVQAHPAWQQEARHSQHPWINLQQSLSPEEQVMQIPFGVGSHRQLQKQRLHWATQIPFFVHVQLHIPSARLRQRFWSVPQAA
jgi:hypothetical protein